MDKFCEGFQWKKLILLGVLIFFLFQIKDITLLFFASFVIASAVNPAVDWLNKKMSRGLAVLTIYMAGFIIGTVILVPLIAVLSREVTAFITQIPIIWQHALILINKLVITGRGMGVSANISQISTSAAGLGSNILSQSINFTISFVGGFVVAFTLAIIVLYMILDKRELKDGLLRFFPKEVRDRANSICISISRKVGGYVVGQLMSMIAVAVLAAAGFFLIKLKFALLLGFISGILDIIPIVGPILSVVLICLVAISQKPILAVWAILIFTAVQWITNSFVRPYIFSKFLDLHPLIIIFALLVSANWLGVVGVILSPAIAATIWVLIEEFYLSKINTPNELSQ